MRALLFALLLVGCAETVPPVSPAAAPQVRPFSCAPRPIMLTTLANHFGEVLVAGGMTRQGVVMEILAAEDGETFTILYSSFRTGVSCVAHHGEGWRFKPPPQEGEMS